MKEENNKTLIILSTIFFALLFCGAVSAAGNLSVCKNLSIISAHPVNTEVSTITSPKLIDQGVTLTKEYLVKKDSLGRYSIYGQGTAYYGMKYPTKYYWKTYLYPGGTIIVYTHFYHTTLQQNMYQRIIIGKKSFYGNPPALYLYITPKSWGNSGHQTVYSTWGTPLNFYWRPNSYIGHSLRYYMINNPVMD